MGLIVNPIAGMGGSVGLKGTDGAEILAEALRRGAKPVAPDRCKAALSSLKQAIPGVRLVTCPGQMGEKEAAEAGVAFDLLPIDVGDKTSASETQAAAKLLAERSIELLLFAGGDGTARDISGAVGAKVPVLGIPCGVKNYSAVFATSPYVVGDIVASYVRGEIGAVESEVLDYDEEAMREGVITTRICGTLRVPNSRRLMQYAKSATPTDATLENEAIAKFIVEEMEPNIQYILGPGSTTNEIAKYLHVEKTILGVDLILNRRLDRKDLTGRELESIIRERPSKLVISPIGGQGYILGRGNQQLTPSALKAIGRDNIIIVCSRTKLAGLGQRRFLVDTGDHELDENLTGYWRVVTGYREFAVVKVERA